MFFNTSLSHIENVVGYAVTFFITNIKSLLEKSSQIAEHLYHTRQLLFNRYIVITRNFLELTIFTKLFKGRKWCPTQGDESLTHLIQITIDFFHIVIHLWMPSHKATTTHIPMN